MKTVGQRLMKWFKQNKRELPWRNSTDPYFIWLSEIILQQTRVQQGLPYFRRFIDEYPTVKQLANASQDKVFKLWQGLGYYRRAENMIKTARIVATEFNGVFPKTSGELKRLPGIGEYTAAAIASIAYGEKVAVVDGNVYRVLARLFGIKTVIQTTQSKKEFSSVMLSLMEDFYPGTFNEAVMEFGALHCVPQNPDCNGCILNDRCFAYMHNQVQELPVVKTKKKKKKLFIYYFVVEWNNHLMLNHRKKNEIWKELYDFPSAEYDSEQTDEVILKTIKELNFITPQTVTITTPFSRVYKHQLTHIDVFAQFIRISSNKKPILKRHQNLYLVPRNKVTEYAVSRLVDRYLDDVE